MTIENVKPRTLADYADRPEEAVGKWFESAYSPPVVVSGRATAKEFGDYWLVDQDRIIWSTNDHEFNEVPAPDAEPKLSDMKGSVPDMTGGLSSEEFVEQLRTGERDVTRQNHYTALSPQPLEVIVAWGLNFTLGNVVKYVARESRKNGLEDLKKARHYLDVEIAKRETGEIKEAIGG